METQKQMVHGGVPRQDHPVNAPGVDACGAVHGGQHGDDGLLDDRVLEAFAPAGPAGFDDAVDHVRAIADLAVAAAGLGQDLPGLQIHQHTGQGRGAQIQGKPYQRLLAVLGEHVPDQDAVIVPGNHALDAEPALPQRLAQLPQHPVWQHDGRLGHAGGLLHRPEQAFIVGHGVLQGGLGQIQGQEGQVAAKGDPGLLQLAVQVLKDGNFLRG